MPGNQAAKPGAGKGGTEAANGKRKIIYQNLHAVQHIHTELENNDVICLPNNAMRHNDKTINNIESDEGSDQDELELMPDSDQRLSMVQVADKLISMGLDIDFRFIDWNCLFKTHEEAAAFLPLTNYGRPIEVPCIVLFDYHSGFTCMDTTVIGGDLVYVCAEEHETMLVGRADDEEWKAMKRPTGFLRLQQWSLARRYTPRQLYSQLGLIPSSFIVSEKFYNDYNKIFVDNYWYLGLCSFDAAFDYLLTDDTVAQPGLFVIFSPRWLNIDPNEFRPFILMMLVERSKESRKIVDKVEEIASHVFQPHAEDLYRLHNETQFKILKQLAGQECDSPDFLDEGDPSIIKQEANAAAEREANNLNKPIQDKIEDSKESESKLKQDRARFGDKTIFQMVTQEGKKSKDGASSKKPTPLAAPSKETASEKPQEVINPDEAYWTEPSIDDFALAGGGRYAWLHYTITRSFMGDYEIFGRRYATLYHLVVDLAHRESNLPVRLVYDKLTLPPTFKVTPMEPPIRNPKRQPNSLPMFCEQWAAKHYTQHTEPNFISSPMSYVIRHVVDPAMKMFTSKISAQDVDTLKKIFLDKSNIPSEEHVVSFSPKLAIDPQEMTKEEKEIGHGNFGCVYRGMLRDSNGKWVKTVVKEVKVEEDGSSKMTPFAEEADISTALIHPNIVAFYGLRLISAGVQAGDGEELEIAEGMRDDDAYPLTAKALMVLEYCDGGTLKDRVKEKKPSVNEAIDYLSQMARGLAYMHTRVPAVVHGDVAARNVLMVAHPRDFGRFICKVADFGLSKFMRAESTAQYNGDAIPANWVAPEAHKTRELSIAGDCWSFGMTIPELYGCNNPWGINEPIGCGAGEGYVHPKDEIPDCLYSLLLMCTRKAAHDRLSMAAADEYLQSHWVEAEGPYVCGVYELASRS